MADEIKKPAKAKKIEETKAEPKPEILSEDSEVKPEE